MKGFNTGSIIYFVLGFLDKKRKDVIIGSYDKIKEEFIIDYTNKLYGKIKEEFLSNGQKLNIVKATGMGYDDFISMQTKGYVYNHCFVIDNFSISLQDKDNLGYLRLENHSSITCLYGLVGDLVWDTGNTFEYCTTYFEYNDFLKLLDIKVLSTEANIVEDYIEF